MDAKRHVKLLLVSLVLLLSFALPLTAGGAGAQEEDAGRPAPASPEVAARAWALVDLRSGERLAGENADEALPMASTTKVMVALVVLEMVEEGMVSLDEEVVVSEEAASYAVPAYSNIGLFAGDVLSVRELLVASLVASGDDAAYALAEHLGGGGEAGVERFVAMMNQKADAMGLRETRFEDPIGFDAPGHHSSAGDLAEMTRAAYEHQEFGEIVSRREATITTRDREIPLRNTNDLLYGYPPAVGVKTGTTPAAGPSLVSAAASGDESYVAVVLDAPDRFAESVEALEYGFAAHDRRSVVRRGERYAEAPLPYRPDEEVRLVAEEDVGGLVGPGEEVERRVEVTEELPEEARRGTPLGEVVAYVGGERIGASPLVAEEGYEAAPLWRKVWYTAGGIFD